VRSYPVEIYKKMRKQAENKEVRIQGVAASPGIAIGEIFILRGDILKVETKSLQDKEIETEIAKFLVALEKTKDELLKLRTETALALGEDNAKIFDAHRLMLEDEMIIDETVKRVKTEKRNADLIFLKVIESFEASMANMGDEYLRARSTDLRDIKRRVIKNYQGDGRSSFDQLPHPVIVISRELTPSDTVSLDRSKVLAFATDVGGRTSHAAIMARSLKIPSVVGLVSACQRMNNGDTAILDGSQGILIVNPSRRTREKYKKRQTAYDRFGQKLEQNRLLPARTKDGKDIELSANIEFPEEAITLSDQGAYGVGLYRTEYLFLTRDQLPSEEEQFEEYSKLFKALNDQPIVIRTLDIGGDKLPQSISLPPEENPFLGIRSVRLYKIREEIFKTQLRAIIRASVLGNIRIMFPMISCVAEMRYCNEMVSRVKTELQAAKIPFAQDIPLGAMIEVPSAAVISDLIALECDFLSIGTNDLIQYTLAVDRGNEQVAYLYQAFNPAVLRLISLIIQKGHEQGVWVGMCGEMASDPLATMALIGLGLDEFSVSPVSLLLIKEIIRRVEYTECENMAGRVLGYSSPEEVEEYLQLIFNKKFKDLIL
jgi:phosphotransferase system enzyme I (PtsI)